ncbi:MAG: hypothetical protein ABW128_16910 [Rhizorhabdus sp.]
MRVLVACESSGVVREAFRARGHDAWSCDLLPADDGSFFHIQDDALKVANDPDCHWDLMIAHPPCTYLCNSGVRWLYTQAGRRKAMNDAAKFFAGLLQAPIPKIAVENPVMHGYGQSAILNFLGTPMARMNTHFVHPWWFGDKAFKATGLTLKGLPPLVRPADALTPPKPGTPEHKAWSVIHNQPPGPERWKVRSKTFPGIAQAMAETWG